MYLKGMIINYKINQVQGMNLFKVTALSLLTIVLCIQCKEKSKPIAMETAKEKRPNFLFVLVDDQSPLDLKVYDPNSQLETPTINSLASGGMVIESARHMGAMVGAVCTPSRHMIMSGRTLWSLPSMQGYINSESPENLEESTIGAVFTRAGYSTMRTCKKGNSYNRGQSNNLLWSTTRPNEAVRKNRAALGMAIKY